MDALRNPSSNHLTPDLADGSASGLTGPLRVVSNVIAQGGLGGGLLLIVIMGMAHFALAQFVLLLNDPVQVGMNFWPSAGLTLGVLLLVPTRRWGWALAAVAAAEFTSNVIHGHPFSVNIWFMGSNTIEPLIGATLIRRFGQHQGSLIPIRGFLELIVFGALIAPVFGGAIGSVGSMNAGAVYLDAWPRFAVGDALGVLVVAPVLLTFRRTHDNHPMTRAIAPAVITTVVAAFAIHSWPGGWDTVTPYLVIPPLIWAALRS
ncbi:MAG: MASE1 domain-containing protein, partial [Dehalococcoidia bacterium]